MCDKVYILFCRFIFICSTVFSSWIYLLTTFNANHIYFIFNFVLIHGMQNVCRVWRYVQYWSWRYIYELFEVSTIRKELKFGFVCQKQVSRAGTSNYIPQILWNVITYSCPWYLPLAHKSSYTVGHYWCSDNLTFGYKITDTKALFNKFTLC